MSEMPERDVSGKCDDFEDLVKKGEKERQKKVEESGVESPEEYPDAPGAKSRNAPPGSMGGKV
jgi:hypothetical protein